MYMYIYMYKYAYMYTCMYILRMHTCAHQRECTCARIHTQTHLNS